MASAQKAAFARGLKPDEFWRLTPYELNVWLAPIIEREAAQIKNDYALAAYGAWHVAAFSRQKRMPTLKKVMNSFMPKREQSMQDMLRTVEDLNKMFGGKDMRAKA